MAAPLDEFRRLTVARFEVRLNRVAQALLDVLAKEGLECENVGVVRTPGLEFQILMVPAYETSFCLYRPEGNTTFVAVQGLGREHDDVAGVLLRMVGELLRAGAQGEG